MSTPRSVLRGHLHLKIAGGLVGSFTSASKYYVKLYPPASMGGCRLDFFKKDTDASANCSCKLDANTEIEVVRSKKQTRIKYGSQTYEVGFSSENEMIRWMSKIKELQPRVGFRGNTSVLDTVIYEPIPDPQRDRGPFDIDIQANSKLPYSGPAKLKIEVIEGQRLYIIDLYYMQRNRSQQIVRWQIDHLRGYGSSDSVLKIETGRKTPTGPGIFVFKTSQAETIRAAIHYWATEISRVGNIPRSTTVSQPQSSTYQEIDTANRDEGPYVGLRRNTADPVPTPASPSGMEPSPAYMSLDVASKVTTVYEPLTKSKSKTKTPKVPMATSSPVPPPPEAPQEGSQYMALDRSHQESNYQSLKAS